MSEQLSQLYAQRGARIAALQGEQYANALDDCASRHPEVLGELIEIASEQGGIPSNTPVNGETLGQLESWVGSATDAAFDLMTEAAAAPEGSAARQAALDRLRRLLDARRQVVNELGPLRDCDAPIGRQAGSGRGRQR